MLKTCKGCGIQFETVIPVQVFCCKNCSKNYFKRMYKLPKQTYKVTCPICGTEFETTISYQKFCSKKCYKKAELNKERLKRGVAQVKPKQKQPREWTPALKHFFGEIAKAVFPDG